jgi:hypothetical protein
VLFSRGKPILPVWLGENSYVQPAMNHSAMDSNVKEHATLSAGASVDHGVDVEVTKGHVNWAADRGCVSRLVGLFDYVSVK